MLYFGLNCGFLLPVKPKSLDIQLEDKNSQGRNKDTQGPDVHVERENICSKDYDQQNHVKQIKHFEVLQGLL